MKGIRFILAGIVFGIVMTKSEAISWYRIQEMFHFQSFHMFGIIGTAVTLGVIGVYLIKRFKVNDMHGQPIRFTPKEKGFWRYMIGGSIFGLGWALVGACPGPMFVNLGYGIITIAITIGSAILGTFIYGLVRDKLPH